MREILKSFPLQVDPNLIVGHAGADDAGVYRIDDERAIVMTVDFFTPVVDDPFDYGRVAAANSLSDVYAMGGRPFAALNIAAFPENELPDEVLGDILRGGAAVAKDAGIVIAGGHTVSDAEIKYGLSVVGLVHPDRIITNDGAVPGDVLILTKAVGTGVLTTALKADDLPDAEYEALIASMTTLNRAGGELMEKYGVRGGTDITGNALLGHGFEMAEASDVALEIRAADVPVLPGAHTAVKKRYLTAGDARNRTYVGETIRRDGDVDETTEHLFYDPQTSGGLLMAVPSSKSETLLEELRKTYKEAAIIGAVIKSEGGVRIRLV